MKDGRKDDEGKLRYDLIPLAAEREVARVLTHGAEKYGPDNWREVPNLRQRYHAAARRHLADAMLGHTFDIDGTDLYNIAQAITCLLFILETDLDAGSVAPESPRLTEGLEEASSRG